MEVWAVVYDESSISEELYQQALSLVDVESAKRIQRFYHRADACRTLIGRLLRRSLFSDRYRLNEVDFPVTQAGKPYAMSGPSEVQIAFNVAHDNSLIVLGFVQATHHQALSTIGIDVMKVKTPPRYSFSAFVETMSEQLTARERRQLFLGISEDEGIRRFFWMWTLKEAYTKALGTGMGFDFRRVEFDVEDRVVRVDGEILKGWKFTQFEIQRGDDLYQGVVAEHGDAGDATTVYPPSAGSANLTSYQADEFIRRALKATVAPSNQSP